LGKPAPGFPVGVGVGVGVGVLDGVGVGVGTGVVALVAGRAKEVVRKEKRSVRVSFIFFLFVVGGKGDMRVVVRGEDCWIGD